MTRMLILKLDDHLECLKPFLIALNYWTSNVGKVNGSFIVDSEIGLDFDIVKVIRQTIK